MLKKSAKAENKYLFISHVKLDSSYGAAKSANLLITMLSEIPNMELEIYEAQSVKDLIKSMYKKVQSGTNLALLPWNNNFDASTKLAQSTYRQFKLNLHNIVSKHALRYSFKGIIDNPNLRIVHLNSLVLAESTHFLRKRKDIKIICHIREVCIFNKPTADAMKNIDGFICIDDKTKKSLIDCYRIPEDKIALIPNSLKNISQEVSINQNIEIKKPIQIGLVGQIHPNKGHELIIDSVKRLPQDDFELNIVGTVNGNEYAKSLISSTKYCKNISWWGHVEDFFEKGQYRKFDLLIRGDQDHRVGRTMYEGLIYGNLLLLPLLKNEKITDKFLLGHKENIITYEANNLSDLVKKLLYIKERELKFQFQSCNNQIIDFNRENSVKLKNFLNSCL